VSASPHTLKRMRVPSFDAAFGASKKFVDIEAITDMRQLDQNHVVPNMGNWFERGVWFPLGYRPNADARNH
jgi:hypothetical protein